MPLAVLEGLVKGNLAYRCHAQKDPELQKFYGEFAEWQLRGLEDAPAIYVRQLVNKTYKPLTLAQKRQVVDAMRRYVAQYPSREFDPQLAMEIDKANNTLADAVRNKRYYLGVGYRRPQWRLEAIRVWSDATDKLIEPDPEKPLPRCDSYVGYARRASTHFREHDRGGSSSFQMQFIKAVCDYLFPGEFHFESFVVSYIPIHECTAVAELLLTRISNSVCESGLGFGVWPAGQNIDSAKKGDTAWEGNQAFLLDNVDYRENWAREEKLIPVYTGYQTHRQAQRAEREKAEKQHKDLFQQSAEEFKTKDFSQFYRDLEGFRSKSTLPDQ